MAGIFDPLLWLCEVERFFYLHRDLQVNTVKMTTMEEGESTSTEDIPAGNPDELTKNPTALKGKMILELVTLKFIVVGSMLQLETSNYPDFSNAILSKE